VPLWVPNFINIFPWAVFLFNIMGEDKSYFVDLYKVQVMDSGKPGESLVDFLNNWMSLSNLPLRPPV